MATTKVVATTLVVIGFILLDPAHFGFPALTKVAGYELMACALGAWYMMAHAIFAQVFGRDVLPVGKPWIRSRVRLPAVPATPTPIDRRKSLRRAV